MFGPDNPLDEHLQFLAGRPSRSGRQARVVRALDAAVPGWDAFIISSAFKQWLKERNPVTGTDRAAMFEAMWDRRDEKSLTVLLRLYVEFRAGKRPGLGSALANSRLRVGDLIAEHYEVIDALGAGGFGEVFLVVSHEHQYYDYGALKLLRQDRLPDAHTRARFEKEARVLSAIGAHPHLVPPQCIERVENSWAIVSEYVLPDVQGRLTLADHMSAGILPADARARIIVQACAGLASAYRDGLAAHRDLKPTNILIDCNGCTRVVDFGLASLKGDRPEYPASPSSTSSREPASNLTQVGTAFGTPAYMPPEQFFNAKGCDERSDIYSLGIVLFEMTEGRLPFLARGNDFAAWAQLHCSVEIPRVLSRFFPVIERCLMKNPEDRFLSVDELADAVRRVCENAGMAPPVTQEVKNEGRGRFDDLVLRGVAFSRLGEHEKAITLYREALSILDLSTDVWCRLAFSYNALGRWDEALEAFSKSNSSSRDGGQEYNLGYTYFHRSNSMGDRSTALAHFKSAAQKDPQLMAAWSMIARCELSLDRPSEGLDALTTCSALPDATIDVWLRKADLELQLGRTTDAERSQAVIKRSLDNLTGEQRRVLLEIERRIHVQLLSRAFLKLLGPGFTPAKGHALAAGLLDAKRAGQLDADCAPALVRSINPAVLHRQALAMYELVMKDPAG
jgi:eukaryotic-like serine/threonine-protein kinase